MQPHHTKAENKKSKTDIISYTFDKWFENWRSQEVLVPVSLPHGGDGC